MSDAISVELTARKTAARARLDFVEEALAARQRRLLGRTVLRPDIDLDDYSCRAVIDWVDLVFRTDRATQWIWAQREIEKNWAEMPYPGPSGGGHERVQGVSRPISGAGIRAVDRRREGH